MKKSFLILSVALAVFAISSCEDPKPADPEDSGTEQPEDPDDPGTEEPDEPTIEVTDLNASNPETANCYIISKGGRYCFNATVMGNGNDGLMESFDTKTTAIEPTKAVLVWEDTGGLITDVELVDGKLYFTCGRGDGNAVVAATDDAGTVLWSWHIWSSVEPGTVAVNYSYPADEESEYAGEEGTWEVMDRNLGAFSNDVTDMENSYGLYYQWGRKDPFSLFLLDQSLPGCHQVAGSADENNGQNTIEYSIANPSTWLIAYQYGADADQRSWVYSADVEGQYKFNELWGNNCTYGYHETYPQKTIYDPCPAGYRIATHLFYMYCKDSGGNWASTQEGDLTIYEGLTIPKAGFIDYSMGVVTTDTSVWTDSAAWGGNDKSFRVIPGDSNDQTGRGRAFPVRCMKVK